MINSDQDKQRFSVFRLTGLCFQIGFINHRYLIQNDAAEYFKHQMHFLSNQQPTQAQNNNKIVTIKMTLTLIYRVALEEQKTRN